MKTIHLLFPGQGAQVVGMGRDLAEAIPACAQVFAEASDVLGIDLAKLCFEGPIEELTRSSNTQPAIFAMSVAARAALKALADEAGIEFAVAGAAGLSSGEWAALHEAGVVSFADALRILRARGTFMQEACDATPGGMLTVIGLAPEKCEELAAQTGLEVANYNSPLQTVLSGRLELVEPAAAVAKAAGAKRALPLRVAGAFHTSLMRPAADKLAAFLEGIDFHAPAIPVWSNVTGRVHDADVASIKRLMVEQVASSVRWAADFADMAASAHMDQGVELGPGTVLSGLARRMAVPVPCASIFDLASARETVKLLA